MDNDVILFRINNDNTEELKIAQKYFHVEFSRVGLFNKTIIGRYSVLPYYFELESDLEKQYSILINKYWNHKYIADFKYYYDIEDVTPKTYFSSVDIPRDIPFVVKGKTNSRKSQWDTMMFASNANEAIDIACRLQADLLIGQQDIIFREYTPLVTYEIGINGQPFTNEWRVFFLFGELVSYGYYWSIAKCAEDPPGLLSFQKDGLELAKNVANRIKSKAPFVAIDVAEKQTGDWTVIEINDGQMSGLSMIDAEMFYFNLKRLLRNKR